MARLSGHHGNTRPTSSINWPHSPDRRSFRSHSVGQEPSARQRGMIWPWKAPSNADAGLWGNDQDRLGPPCGSAPMTVVHGPLDRHTGRRPTFSLMLGPPAMRKAVMISCLGLVAPYRCATGRRCCPFSVSRILLTLPVGVRSGISTISPASISLVFSFCPCLMLMPRRL